MPLEARTYRAFRPSRAPGVLRPVRSKGCHPEMMSPENRAEYERRLAAIAERVRLAMVRRGEWEE